MANNTWTTLFAMFNALTAKGTLMLGLVACLERVLLTDPYESQMEQIKLNLNEMRKILDMMEQEVDNNL